MSAMAQEPRIVRELFGALGEDPYSLFVMTDVCSPSSEPDQIVGTGFRFSVLFGVAEFNFKVAPNLARQWRRDLLCAFNTVLTESGGTAEY
jgi:hypothetical protein